MKSSPQNSFPIKNSPRPEASSPVIRQRADRQRGARESAIEKQAREYADALLDISQVLGLPLCATPAQIAARAKGTVGHVRDLMEALNYLLEQTVDQNLKRGIALTEGESDARAKALAAMGKATGKEEAA